MKNTLETLGRLGLGYRNHLLPFYWQKGNHHEKLVEQIARIQESGAEAFCLESRTHEDFAGPTWWADLDVILSEAEARGMEVWILDDKHFPSGYSNGILERNGRDDLRRWSVVEAHVDVVGPAKETMLLVPRNEDEILLGVSAFHRTIEAEEAFEEAPLDLMPNVNGDYLQWDLPEGVWRVFFSFKSHAGYPRKYFIDLLNPEAVDLFLETCYEPHFKHYEKYFGKTLRGFFSDEPSFANDWGGRFKTTDFGFYGKRPGQPGMAFPWNDSFCDCFKELFGEAWSTLLPAIWYDCGDVTSKVRYAYMDMLTKRYRDVFVKRVGGWCRSHGVEYIGHVIEDQNAHARTCSGTGHYFRAEDGQSMSGMDIVLHQAMPDLGRFRHVASCSTGFVDGVFFHCVLPKMCASAALLDARTKGRAMCEVFGAFGWAEGVPFMKWMMDMLLVRGINHFVPHAFSPDFPNPDCPPHFCAEGHDPQFGAFGALMRYVNATASILEGAPHIANVAILYHAEAEWGSMNEAERMLMQVPAAALMREHIDFDIVPIDAAMEAVPCGRGISLRGREYHMLIVPGAAFLPEDFIRKINGLVADGADIRFVEQKPSGVAVASVEAMEQIISSIARDVVFEGESSEVVHYHVKRVVSARDALATPCDILFLTNESLVKSQHFTISAKWMEQYGECLLLDICRDRVNSVSVNGTMDLILQPGESRFCIFGNGISAPQEAKESASVVVKPRYSLALAESSDLGKFTELGEYDEFFNITGTAFKPDFSGLMRYSFKLTLKAGSRYELDLGEVGSVAELVINGKSLGWRYCRPYSFELENVSDGENDIEIIVGNTLANAVKDKLSRFMQIPRSGLFGPITISAEAIHV